MLIILLMLYSFCLILLLSLAFAENTNFNYTKHGDDWTQGACKSGKKQSPIILSSNAEPSQSFLFGAYQPISANISFYNTTTYINGNLGQLFHMTINKKATPVKANQIRLRCESEHVIQFEGKENYTRFPLQLQIFHVLIEPESSNDKIAVALHYDIGAQQDPIIQSIIDAEKNNATTINIDLSYYIQRGNTYNYWFYLGSPTMPGCTDGSMNWMIIDNRFSITQEQADYFMKQFHGADAKQIDGNYRNLQSTDSKVGYYSFGAV